MTDDELKEIEKLANAASAGPWEVARRDDVMGGFDYFVEAGPMTVAVISEDTRPPRAVLGARHDAAFIAHAREDVPALLAAIRAARADYLRIAEALGRVEYPDGHAPQPASPDELVRRAGELSRAEDERGDARAALAETRYAALMAAGVRGGPGAWRWASDPAGTILSDEAAWERLLGEMREATASRGRFCNAVLGVLS